MKPWTPARQRRAMRFGCFAAALGFPSFLLATDQADKVSPTIVGLVGMFLIAAGVLNSPRSTKGSDDDRRDDDRAPRDRGPDRPESLSEKLRKVAREHMDWPEGLERVASIR